MVYTIPFPSIPTNSPLEVQRRLIHEHYGITIIRGMVLEKALWVLLMAIDNIYLKREDGLDVDIEAMLNKHRLWTFGRLLKEVSKKVQLPIDLQHSLTKAVEDRNYLVHHFILEKSKLLKSLEGLASIDGELRGYYVSFGELNERCDEITIALLKKRLK